MSQSIRKLLREGLFQQESEQDKALMDAFIVFAKDQLGIRDAKIELQFDKKLITTTASYGQGTSRVYAKERATVDIMRSLAHELTHHKQDEEGRLKDPKTDGADGSPIENEANATAGKLIRMFGKLHPEIYD